MRTRAAGEPEGAQGSESIQRWNVKHTVHCDEAGFELLCYFNLLNLRLSLTHLEINFQKLSIGIYS